MKTNKKGFTLVELMLASAFLGTMLLAIASLTIRIVNIYQKGLSVRSVNSIGRDIINDLNRTIGGSKLGVEDINPELTSWGPYKVVSIDNITEARNKYYYSKKRSDGTQAYGIFCTGSKVYVWNTAPTLKELDDGTTTDAISIISSYAGAVAKYPRFAKVDISGFDACASDSTGELNEKQLISNDYEELISKTDSDLALYDFVVQPAVSSKKTGHAFYSISFVLATRSGGVNIMSNGDFCKGENETSSEFSKIGLEYCAVNKFDIVVQQSATNRIERY